MERFRRSKFRRILASIACLAFALQGLVPSLAHALASTARAQLYPGELCSADPHAGYRRFAQALDAEVPASAPSLPDAAHCPFCALPLGAEALPSTPPVRDFRFLQADYPLQIVSPEQLPAPPAQWRPHTPRAPPQG